MRRKLVIALIFNSPIYLTAAALAQAPSSAIVTCAAECEHQYIEGQLFRILRDGDVAVLAGVVDTGKSMKVTVGVANNSKEVSFDVLPKRIELAEEIPKAKSLKYVEPEKMAHTLARRAAWANGLNGFGAGLARQTSTVNTNSDGTLSTTSSDGTSTNGTYNGTSTSTISSPDYAAQAAARQRIAERNAQVQAQAALLMNTTLKPTTLTPGTTTFGDLYYEREKKAEKVLLTVELNGKSYHFEFAPKNQ